MKKSKVIVRLLAELYEAQDKIKILEDNVQRREAWLKQAKADAGYPDDASFDTIWQQALFALKNRRGTV